MKKALFTLLLSVMFLSLFGTVNSKASSGVVDLESSTTEAVSTEDPSGSTQDNTTAAGTNDGTTTNPVVSGMEDGINIQEGDQITNIDNIYPKVDSENFFQRTYRKLLEGTSFFQRIVAIIIGICFIICLMMIPVTIVSGNKGRVVIFIIGMVICLFCLVADLFAIPIMNQFTEWFSS